MEHKGSITFPSPHLADSCVIKLLHKCDSAEQKIYCSNELLTAKKDKKRPTGFTAGTEETSSSGVLPAQA
eukprot:4235612-Amphidinium_carterae.1